jgi:cell division ATPase FtsA
MPFFKIFSSRKQKLDNFLILEIGLEKVTAAVFEKPTGGFTSSASASEDSKEEVSFKGPHLVGIGRKNVPTTMDLLDSISEAMEAVSAIVKDIPQSTVLGVNASDMETVTTVVKYQRPDPQSKIEVNEIEQVIEHSGKEKAPSDKKLFFATVTSTLIDGTLVANPVGLTGENLEVSCFNAFKPEQELSVYAKLVEELDLKLQKIVPTSYAVARGMIKSGVKEAILLWVGLESTEVTFVSNAHVVGIRSLALGSNNPNFWMTGVEVVLEEFKEHHPWPQAIKAYGEASGLEKVRPELLTFPWTKKFELDHFPKIEIVHYQQIGLESDLGIAALSLEV